MQRSLALMRGRGFRCFIVEYHTRGLKHDLFGFADILCLSENDIVAVQTTTRSNISARIQKITDSEELQYVRKAGIRILVHGWGYLKRSKAWDCDERDLS